VTTIETARLRLRMWRDDDVDALVPMHADEEVVRYLEDGSVQDRERVARSVAAWREDWDRHGFGLWCAELRESGEAIGFVGLAYPTWLPEAMPDVEVGWRLRRDVWGRGLATEGGRASLAYAFDELGLTRVISIHQPSNIASRRVMEKLGLRHESDVLHPVHGYRLSIFALDREGWLQR